MLTLKIRVPYKEGQVEDILTELDKHLSQHWDRIHSYGIVDNHIEIVIGDLAPDLTLDLRLLEITGG